MSAHGCFGDWQTCRCPRCMPHLHDQVMTTKGAAPAHENAAPKDRFVSIRITGSGINVNETVPRLVATQIIAFIDSQKPKKAVPNPPI